MVRVKAFRYNEFGAHHSSVRCVHVGSMSGQLLASGGDDCRVNLWRVGAAASLGSLPSMKKPVLSVKFDSTERSVLAGTESGVLKVYDLEKLKALKSLKGHRTGVGSLDWHPYNRSICASGGQDTLVKLWDVRLKLEYMTYKAHKRPVTCIHFSPDGRLLSTGDEDGVVKVWDLTAGKELHSFDTHRAAISCVAFHPEEFLLASGSADRSVKIWDLQRAEVAASVPHELRTIQTIAWAACRDGQALVTTTSEGAKSWGFRGDHIDLLGQVDGSWGNITSLYIGRNTVGGDSAARDGIPSTLIAAGFAANIVSVWGADLRTVPPFDDMSQPAATSVPAPASEPTAAPAAAAAPPSPGRDPRQHSRRATAAAAAAEPSVDVESSDEFKDHWAVSTKASLAGLPSAATLGRTQSERTKRGLGVSIQESEILAALEMEARAAAVGGITPIQVRPRSASDQLASGGRLDPRPGGGDGTSGTASGAAAPGAAPPADMSTHERLMAALTRGTAGDGSRPSTGLPPVAARSADPTGFAAEVERRRAHRAPSAATAAADAGAGVPSSSASGRPPTASRSPPRRSKSSQGARPQRKPKAAGGKAPARLNKRFGAAARKKPLIGVGFGMVPSERATPIGLNYSDFLPGGPDPFGGKLAPPEPDPEAIHKELEENRPWVTSVLAQRLQQLQSLKSLWFAGDIAGCLMMLTSSRDAGLLNDVLRGAPLSAGGNFTMEHVCMLLPAVTELLTSTCDEYATTAVKTVSGLVDTFGDVIKATRGLSAGGGGVDIAREERIKRCSVASDLITAALPTVEQLATRGGLLGWHATALLDDLQAFVVGL